MKRILITGGSGFLGQRLISELKNRNYVVCTPSSREFDLTCKATKDLFTAEKFDEIWHLAVWTQAGTFCDLRRGDQWLINQSINTNMLDYWRGFQPQAKLVAFGTSVSFSSEDNLSEEVYMDGQPKDKFLAYAMCKRMLLVGLECLNRQYGMQYLYIIPSTMYGPNYHTDGRQLHFVYDLIRKILNAKRGGEPVVLWGDGNQTRELVYIDDFVDQAIALNRELSNTIINIGSGQGISIKSFAKSICEMVGYDYQKITYDTSQYVGAKSKCLSIKKLDAILPDRKLTPLSEGLQRTIDWVSENLDKLNQIK